MSLTQPQINEVYGVPVWVDEHLAKPPRNTDQLTLKERYAKLEHYAAKILGASLPAKPVSLAFFGGRMDFFRLSLLAKLFTMVIIQAQAGDHRNWASIKAWANSLPWTS